MKCNKTIYATEQAALFDLEKIKKTSQRDKIPIRAYFCKICNGWHLTSRQDLNIEIEKFKELLKSYKQYLEQEKLINAELLKEINDKNKKITDQKLLIKILENKIKEMTLKSIKKDVIKHPKFKQ